MKLGTAFGIDIYVHWTFLLLPLYLVLSGTGGGIPMLLMLAFVAAVFGCVVLHELGHALTARSFGIQTRDITLYPIGGVARLERMSEKPWEEFWIAVAGPAVNVAIAACLAIWLPLTEGLAPPLFHALAANLLTANLVLVAFNLLPAFPMDGGRVLRAVLSRWYDRVRATQISVNVALVIAAAMFLWAVAQWQPFLMLGAMFVYFAGMQELAAVKYRAATSAATPRQVTPVDDQVAQSASGSSTAAFTGFTWDARGRRWIWWRDGRPVQAISAD